MAHDPVAEVRERLDIVDLIQEYVPSLKRTGASYKGLCPFHQEKTPSFIVFPNTQSYHCFGCGKGGDVFSFYMGVENVDFRDALQELGRRAGVEIATTAPRPPEEDEKRKQLIAINELAAMWFNHVLISTPHGTAGREVVEQRHLSEESIRSWKLGFAPDGWDTLLNFMASRNYSPEMVAAAGLASVRDSGGYYDRFRNRLMFPIRDRDGNTVGFGGRALGDDQPKYLNTAQTEIFDKSTLLYGLDLAKDAIHQTGQVVIVEGYMDAIATHAAGYKNVVASMGTALTDAQVGQIRRGNPTIILALDSDAAGQMATLRGLQTVTDNLDADVTPVVTANRILGFERRIKSEIRIVQLQGGKDPDEIVRSEPGRWPNIVAQAVPFMDFVIDTVTRDVDLTDANAKSEAVKQVVPLLRQLPDPVRENHYTRMLARKLDLTESAIAQAKRALRQQRHRPHGALSRAATQKPAIVTSSEDHLMALLITYHQVNYAVLGTLEPEDFADPRNREILEVLKLPETASLQGEQFIIGLPDTLADHAESLVERLGPRPKLLGGQVIMETEQASQRLRKTAHERLVSQIQAAISAARKEGDTDIVNELVTEYQRVMQRRLEFSPAESPYFHDTRTEKKR